MKPAGFAPPLVAAMLGLVGCGSSQPAPASAQPPVTTHSCSRPKHYYAIAAIVQAFDAHGLHLYQETESPPDQGGSIPRAFRTGLAHGLSTKNRAVIIDVVSRRAPAWLDNLVLNCGRLPSVYVRGNIGLDYRPRDAKAAKAALEAVR